MINPRYSIVVPVYNEELVIMKCWQRLTDVMSMLKEEYEIVLVNDGSRDNTEKLCLQICSKDTHVKLINFSRNFGHQAAITAGMDYASGDAIIIIDADLQDPPEMIPKMIEKWKADYDVVYGKRIKRKGETIFKKAASYFFYRFLRKMTSVEIPVDAGDFRLIDRKVRDALQRLPEKHRYVRGLVSWLGFKQTGLEFIREERYAGKTKYTPRKMLVFAMDAVTAFSYKPLKLAAFFGFIISALSFLYLLFVVYLKLFTTATVPGWSSIVAINLFFNGFILIILGIFGEYIGRIYDEVKSRPLYVVSEYVGFGETENKKYCV